jgi:hypothetical protein
MICDLTTARSKAEKEFLGQEHIIGVGISNQAAEQLVFFVDHSSVSTEDRVAAWARGLGVNVEFRVVGGFKPLSR